METIWFWGSFPGLSPSGCRSYFYFWDCLFHLFRPLFLRCCRWFIFHWQHQVSINPEKEENSMLRKWLYTFYVFTLTILTSGVSFAADEASSVDGSTKVALALAAGFGIALAAFGGTLGQGRAASSALEG